MGSNRIVAVIFLLVGLGLLGGGGWSLRDTLDLRERGDRVSAEIVSFSVSTDEDGTSYAPIYEYAVDGQTYRHEASVSSSDRPQVGASEVLLVDPDDPEHAKPATFMGQWFFVTLFGGMGATFTIIALVLLAATGQTRRTTGASTPEPVGTTHDADHTDHDPFVGDDSPAESRGPFL